MWEALGHGVSTPEGVGIATALASAAGIIVAGATVGSGVIQLMQLRQGQAPADPLIEVRIGSPDEFGLCRVAIEAVNPSAAVMVVEAVRLKRPRWGGFLVDEQTAGAAERERRAGNAPAPFRRSRTVALGLRVARAGATTSVLSLRTFARTEQAADRSYGAVFIAFAPRRAPAEVALVFTTRIKGNRNTRRQTTVWEQVPPP